LAIDQKKWGASAPHFAFDSMVCCLIGKDRGGGLDSRLPDQEADDAPFGVGRGDPHSDLTAAGANIDTSAHADQKGEILTDIGFSLDGQASVTAEAGLDATDNWNRRKAINFQVGRKSLFRRYNHRSFLL